MALAFTRQIGHPPAEQESNLEVAVVFTSVSATLAALNRAAVLAQSLSARIALLVPQVVPYPLPLESPPVLLDFSQRRFQVIAAEVPVQTGVRIYLCRDRLEALKTALAPRSLVVLGGSRRWWLGAEQRLARQLRRAGHEVVFTETE